MAFGRVRDANGNGLEAEVTVKTADGRVRRASSSSIGAWSCLGLQPGPTQFQVVLEGYARESRTVVVPPQLAIELNVELHRPWDLPVLIEDEAGEKIGSDHEWIRSSYLGVAVTAEPLAQGLPDRVGRAVQRSELAKWIPGWKSKYPNHSGLLRVDRQTAAWANLMIRGAVVSSRPLTGLESELVFVVTPRSFDGLLGEVRVVVLEHSGELVDSVGLQPTQGGRGIGPEVESGQLVFRNIPPGDYILDAASLNGAPVALPFLLEPGSSRDLGTVRLHPRISFWVRVTDSAGDPVVTEVQAGVPGFEGELLTFERMNRARTDIDGEAWFQRIGAERVWIRAGGSEGWGRVVHSVEVRLEDRLKLVLEPGVPVRFVAEGGLRYEIDTAAGQPIDRGFGTPAEIDLSPGSYLWTQFSRNGLHAQGSFQVESAVRGVVVRWDS